MKSVHSFIVCNDKCFYHFNIGIVSYMKKQAGPSSTYLSSAKAIKDFIASSDENRAVAFFFI